MYCFLMAVLWLELAHTGELTALAVGKSRSFSGLIFETVLLSLN